MKNPEPLLIAQEAWDKAIKLGNFERKPAQIIPRFLTAMAVDHFGHPPKLDEISIGPVFDEVEFAITEALHVLGGSLLGHDEFETNVENEFRIPSNRDSANFTRPHIDREGSSLLLTLFQEPGAMNTPWQFRYWPNYNRAPSRRIDSQYVSRRALLEHGGTPVDIPTPAGTLVLLGCKSIQATTGNYSVPHQAVRPAYRDRRINDRIVRTRAVVFSILEA